MDAACIIRASCPPPMMPTVKLRALVTRRSVPVTMTGSLRRLQELAAVLRAELAPVRERRRRRICELARQSAINTGAMTGESASPTAGGCESIRVEWPSLGSQATKEANLRAARQSAINIGHCSLKITERCTMKLTVVATPGRSRTQ